MNVNKAFYPLLFAMILASGIFLGYKLQERNASRFKIYQNGGAGSKLDYILQLIDAKYVDTVNQKDLYDKTINEMLMALDPHSVYLPPVESQHEGEIMEGNFEGIGIEFLISRDTIQVVTPIAGGPSEQAGISAGDKIIKVNDTLVAGIGITNEMVMKKLKGPKGSRVKVTVKKNSGKQVSYMIKRDRIPIYSVDAGFLLTPNTGYIKINRFSKTTYEEFAQHLDSLKNLGMTKLILDLRGNGGGYLDQAVDIVDEFLDNKKLIVYTEGRTMPRMEQKAEKVGNFEDGQLVVLIDEGSASASEIVSGAIQDWDRGTIIGRRSFGKGLVQEEYPFPDGSALRLTIAKYYTPSGRCIQRPYTDGTEAYYGDVAKRFSDGEVFIKDSIHNNKQEVYQTKIKKRTVYGGGGITPDIFIPLDTSMFNPFVTEVYNNGLLNEFAYNYYYQHKAEFTGYKDVPDFFKRFQLSDALYKEFTSYVLKNGVNVAAEKFAPASRNYLALRLKAFIARQAFRTDGYYFVIAQDDEMIGKALQLLK